MKRVLLTITVGLAAVSLSAEAGAVTLSATKCNSVSDPAGCLFENGNIANAGNVSAAQNVYNAAKNPDITLNLLFESGSPFPGTITFDDASQTSGTWSLPGYLVDFLAVKAGNDFVLYQLASPASSGTWTTANLVNNRGIRRQLSHLTFFGAQAVPEPASWAMMLGGFGLLGAATRRRSRVQVTHS